MVLSYELEDLLAHFPAPFLGRSPVNSVPAAYIGQDIPLAGVLRNIASADLKADAVLFDNGDIAFNFGKVASFIYFGL